MGGQTSGDNCFVEVTIAQSNCEDTLDMITLFEYFEFGIMDELSEIHMWIHDEPNIPTGSTIDPTVFFVQQIPSEKKVSAVEAVLANPTETDTASWYMFVAIGFISIILLSSIIYYVFLKK